MTKSHGNEHQETNIIIQRYLVLILILHGYIYIPVNIALIQQEKTITLILETNFDSLLGNKKDLKIMTHMTIQPSKLVFKMSMVCFHVHE